MAEKFVPSLKDFAAPTLVTRGPGIAADMRAVASVASQAWSVCVVFVAPRRRARVADTARSRLPWTPWLKVSSADQYLLPNSNLNA